MTLDEQLERLAAFEPSAHPVVSLYLNTQPNERGRDQYAAFVRKELKARAATYPARSSERQTLERDLERITAFLDGRVQPSANGVAVFACGAANLFETAQLEAPIAQHSLYIGDRPHLYPLARLASTYPRYAVVLADTHRTRILVVAEGRLKADSAVEGVKTRRTMQGGTSQARYQRHVENYHLQHVKDVVATLEKIVQAEGLRRVIVAGDPSVLPLLREQLTKPLTEMVVDELSLPSDAAERDVVRETRAAMRALDSRTDRETVDATVGAYRAGGLGVAGPDATLLALTNGQVDELLISASLPRMDGLRGTAAAEMALANDASLAAPAVQPAAAGEPASADIGVVRLADELVRRARQTGARIHFVEDASLLEPYGGMAATLRYRI